MTSPNVRWHVLPQGEAIAEAVAEHILRAARRAISAHGGFRLVLAGGTTPESAYRRLAEMSADWSRWSIYYGDERCVPPGDESRNSVMADRAWLDHVPIPRAHIHTVPAEHGPTRGAEEYGATVRNALPFDFVLLGMGEDGHTASLFPGQEHDDDEPVVPVYDAPKPPPERVSVNTSALNQSREVHIMVTGAGKRDAVRRWKAGEDLPVGRVHGQCGVDVWLDPEALDASAK
ncbi:MAG: 6-phosphogluconolactonase [Pseudomonadota bacterium]|nr:6-phosphogluconolactonase [Pseudomonadota bacterium]